MRSICLESTTLKNLSPLELYFRDEDELNLGLLWLINWNWNSTLNSSSFGRVKLNESLFILGKTVRSVTSDTPLALNMSRSTSGIPSEYGANCEDTHSPIDSQVSEAL